MPLSTVGVQSSVRPQFINIGDLIGGFRGVSCGVCKQLGCCGSDSDSDRDPVDDLRSTIDNIKKTVRDFNDLRDELRGVFDELEDGVAEHQPSANEKLDENLAAIRTLSSEIRVLLNQKSDAIRIAKSEKSIEVD